MERQYYDINTVSNLLEVSVETVERWISTKELLVIDEGGEGFLNIKIDDLQIFLSKKPKYNQIFIKNQVLNNKADRNSIHSEILSESLQSEQEKIFVQTLQQIDPDILFEAVMKAMSQGVTSKWSNIFNMTTNKFSVVMQPNIDEILDILKNQIFTQVKQGLRIGDLLSRSELAKQFGRDAQEGINFSRDTKEIYLLTRVGSDNPNVDTAFYNDYWKKGKIFYEGKGQQDQILNGSNLHLYRRYQSFYQHVKPKDGVPSFVHVINKIGNKGKCFQYLGMFAVTNWFVDEHSESKTEIGKTKRAFIFELTPLSGSKSNIIDENYHQ